MIEISGILGFTVGAIIAALLIVIVLYFYEIVRFIISIKFISFFVVILLVYLINSWISHSFNMDNWNLFQALILGFWVLGSGYIAFIKK